MGWGGWIQINQSAAAVGVGCIERNHQQRYHYYYTVFVPHTESPRQQKHNIVTHTTR